MHFDGAFGVSVLDYVNYGLALLVKASQWVAKRIRGQLGLAFPPEATCAGQRLAKGYVSAGPTPCSAWQRQLARCSEQAVESVKVTLLPLSHFDLSRYHLQPLSLETHVKTV